MARSSSIARAGPPVLGTPDLKRQVSKTAQPQPRSDPRGRPVADDNDNVNDNDDDNDDDDDKELDELAADCIPCSSPFFLTQPTQIINRATQPTQIISSKATQPTQIINRTALRSSSPPSPSPSPSSPSSTIEVPASSPFQVKSQSKASPMATDNSNGKGKSKAIARSSIASSMAPAGTSFRPPNNTLKSSARAGLSGRAPVGAKYVATSDDELDKDYRKDVSSGDETPMRGDIRPSSFVTRDMRDQKDSRRSPEGRQGSTMTPEEDISLADIHDLRLRHLTRDVHRTVRISKPGITMRECRDALLKGVGWHVSAAVDLIIGGGSNKTKESITKTVGPAQNNHIDLTTNKSVPRTIPQSNASRTTGPNPNPKIQTTLLNLGRFAYNANNSQTLPSASTRQQPPRKRLMQGRRNKSPSPSSVLSLPSTATSPPTSQENSQSDIEMTSATTISQQAEPAVKRRRLVQGRRIQTQPQPILIDSDSDDELLTVAPDVSSRKRHRIEPEPAPEPEDEPEDEIVVRPIQIQSEAESDASETLVGERQRVLDYLNSCSVDELSRMTGLPEDSKLMIEARPFSTLVQAERVSRKEKAKPKSKRKSSRTEIGSLIVEKLASWFNAFEAAANVIKECEERGATLQSIMSTWPMDKNGCTKPSSDLSELPISSKPSLMCADVTLKSYQLLGLNWMDLLHSKGYSGILADDMGLGKTCQVVSFIAHLVGSYLSSDEEDDNEEPPWPNLIVVPPSTYENWLTEFRRFAPELSIMAYYGSTRREIDPEDARNYHVVLTTYTQVERQREDLLFLQQLSPRTAIFDEGHKLKNPKTQIYRQMMRVPSDWRLVLSGTPVQNNLKELLSLLYFVEPDLFDGDDFERLQTIFEAKVRNKDVHNFAALAKERVGNARTIMAPFILQRRKDDVLDLPKKTERLLHVDMHPEQKSIYDEIKGKYLHQPQATKRGAATSTIKTSNSWMQLRKAAIHHQLFRRHFTDAHVEEMADLLWKYCSAEELYVQSKADRHKALLLADLKDKSDFELHTWCKDFKRYIGHLDIPDRSWEESPKVAALLKLVRDYMKEGHRVLVFSRFEMVINILRDALHSAGIAYCELTGRTGTEDRFPEIQRFDTHPDIPAFLLTTGAGGTGLNLTAADRIILFDQSDNPQDDVQASNRAHRIGQRRPVEVVRLVTRGSVEELIYNSCVKKLVLAGYVNGEFDPRNGNGDGDGDDEETSIEEVCRRLMLQESKGEGTTAEAEDER